MRLGSLRVVLASLLPARNAATVQALLARREKPTRDERPVRPQIRKTIKKAITRPSQHHVTNSLLGAPLILACLVGAVSVIAVRSVRQATIWTHFPRTHVSAEAETKAFAEIPNLEKATLRTSDGLTLRGWFAPGTKRAAVVLVHGGGGNRLGLLPEAKLLAKHGYGFLTYDSRASGDSDGDITSWGDREQLDVKAALDYVAARTDVDPTRIAVLGFSIGGSTVALETSRDRRARAVILYATWTSLEDEMKVKEGKFGVLSSAPTLFVLRHSGIDVDAVRPIDRISSIAPRPLLMIAGTRDDDTPLPVMQRVFAAAGQPKGLWVVEGADHGGYLKTAPAEYESRVIGFLDRSLGN